MEPYRHAGKPEEQIRRQGMILLLPSPPRSTNPSRDALSPPTRSLMYARHSKVQKSDALASEEEVGAVSEELVKAIIRGFYGHARRWSGSCPRPRFESSQAGTKDAKSSRVKCFESRIGVPNRSFANRGAEVGRKRGKAG